MPRNPTPWYREATGWCMAQINRKQTKLVEGPPATVRADPRVQEAYLGSVA